MPLYGDGALAVTTALGMPRKAAHVRRDPRVALLFSDATGAGIDRPSIVLVQGTASVDDHDLERNRRRYRVDIELKPTGPAEAPAGERFDWYFTRIYIDVRPARVLVWPGAAARPDVFGSLPAAAAPAPPPSYGHAGTAHRRVGEIGGRYDSAVLSTLGADGHPFSIRLPMTADRRGRWIAIEADDVGCELRPGPACVAAHDHDPELKWMRNFQVRGDLVRDPNGWLVLPHRVVDGFELPPAGSLVRAIGNIPKIRRFRKAAARERARRAAG